MNKVILFGNLTRDPELKSLPSGVQVANFGVATNRVFKDRDGNRQEQVEFHNIVVFGRQAETTSQYMKKGSSALIEGRLQTRSWEKDGQKQYRTEVVADRVEFGSRGAGAGSGGRQVADNAAPDEGGQQVPSGGESSSGIDYPQEEINADDIPF